MPNDDAVGKGGWGVENVSKSDYVILGCSLMVRPLVGGVMGRGNDNSLQWSLHIIG